tara:strand:- start:486 stop:677 length:192 start_codon:yes stop_codon:yes gene_type:complete
MEDLEKFYRLCDEYKKIYNVDITFLNRYLMLDEAIKFIENRNGRKIDIVVDEKSEDKAKPIYI